MKLVCGIGLNEKERPSVGDRSYKTWTSILKDCANPKSSSKIGDFKSYRTFYDWHKSQIGYNSNYRISKDLLDKTNNEFSSSKCVLVPFEVSHFLRRAKDTRGDLPMGVNKLPSGKGFGYIARASFGDKREFLGMRSTPEEAFELYKVAKESKARELAEKYRDQIDPRAYEALLNYKVEITD